MRIDRPQLIATLRRALEAEPAVAAAWEGGSAAFDRDDDLSDIDAIAVADDDAIAGVFARVEQALDRLSPIELRVAMPADPGYAQRFYRLRDAGEFLIVDLVLLRAGQPLQFRDQELHGRGRVWFDRQGLLAEAHLDPAAEGAAARERIPALRASFEMFQHLAMKERLRGHGSDALAFYTAWTLRPLVEALRLLHAPHTRVFGLRYLARDLPGEVVQRVESLSFIRDLAHLGEAQDEAKRWFAGCIDRLERLGPGAGLD
jgi:predicted nucleotidyltransferase